MATQDSIMRAKPYGSIQQRASGGVPGPAGSARRSLQATQQAPTCLEGRNKFCVAQQPQHRGAESGLENAQAAGSLTRGSCSGDRHDRTKRWVPRLLTPAGKSMKGKRNSILLGDDLCRQPGGATPIHTTARAASPEAGISSAVGSMHARTVWQGSKPGPARPASRQPAGDIIEWGKGSKSTPDSRNESGGASATPARVRRRRPSTVIGRPALCSVAAFARLR